MPSKGNLVVVYQVLYIPGTRYIFHFIFNIIFSCGLYFVVLFRARVRWHLIFHVRTRRFPLDRICDRFVFFHMSRSLDHTAEETLAFLHGEESARPLRVLGVVRRFTVKNDSLLGLERGK